MAQVVFWVFCTVAFACWATPRIIRAISEARCEHGWELVAKGPLTSDGRPIGSYAQYRCTKCGAERQYD